MIHTYLDKNTAKQRGFTLVELAIVLVILGLLVGMGASLMGPLTRRVKVHETKEIIDAAVESVIGNVASSNSLPNTAAFPSIVRKSEDVWSNPLVYIYENGLTSSICGRTTTDLSVNDCSDETCTSFVAVNNVAFIILSESENFNNQTYAAGPASAAVNVFDYGLNMDNYAGDGTVVQPYDDIVKWVTIGELQIKADCTGSRLRILNNELPYGFQGSTYNATIYADEGVPYSSGGAYRWCREESASTGLNFTPSILSSDCLSEPEGSWLQADNLVISGSPSSSGSFSLTFFARDDNDSSGANDNIAQKTFVLTVNPVVSSGGCSDYRVWNNTGGSGMFLLDGTCSTVANGNEITTPDFLNSGETMIKGTSAGCGGSTTPFTYNNAVSSNSDGDCCVNFTGSDRACP